MVTLKQQNPYKAALWSLFERLSSQIVGFTIGIVLARILSAHDYGIVGMMTIFLFISNVFIDSGFANALIRKEKRTNADLSTAFYFNCIVGIVTYIILWICSPLIATYFNEPLLVFLVRIAGINIILSSLMIVQTAILTANLNIRLQTLINLAAQIPSGMLAIFCAYSGLGVYALVVQTVSASFFRCIMLWYFAKWRPTEKFNKESFKYLWNFGSKLLSASLIGVIFDQIYSLLIGKYISTESLGYYAKGSHLKDHVSGVTNGIVQKIALPVLARHQNNQEHLRDVFREVMKVLVMFVAPVSAFLCFSAYDIIVLLWTEKWVDCVCVFQLLIVGAMFYPIGSVSLALMQVVGKTGLILKLEFPKKLIYCLFIIVGFMYGVKGLCITQICISITAAVINMWPTKKLLNYSYFTQCMDLGKYMLVAYAIFLCVSIIVPFRECHSLNILFNLFVGIFFYILCLITIKDIVALKYYNKLWKSIHDYSLKRQ